MSVLSTEAIDLEGLELIMESICTAKKYSLDY